VIDYETYARIHDCRDRQGLTITQIARTLGLHRQTVAKWLARSRFERPRPPKRSSILDPFKGRITRLLDTHPYSAQQNGVNIARPAPPCPSPSRRLRGGARNDSVQRTRAARDESGWPRRDAQVRRS
jgi:hypothetical protein